MKKTKTWRYVTKERDPDDGSCPLMEGEVRARNLGNAIDQIRHIMRHGDDSGWTWQLASQNGDGSATMHVKLYLVGTRSGQRDRLVGEFDCDDRAVPLDPLDETRYLRRTRNYG
jgi:hypothetical protein